jgi:hypothetical protein
VSRDVIALVPSEPDLYDFLDGMITAAPSLRVRAVQNGPVIQLCDDDEVTLVSIELPVRVRLPGEVERLLGDPPGSIPDVPLWWVEARAPGTRDGGEHLARRFASTLVERLGGLIWPPLPDEAPEGSEDAGAEGAGAGGVGAEGAAAPEPGGPAPGAERAEDEGAGARASAPWARTEPHAGGTTLHPVPGAPVTAPAAPGGARAPAPPPALGDQGGVALTAIELLAQHPAVDVLTERVAVVLQDRVVVGLSSWLGDLARACGEAGRMLQVVTGTRSRITFPLRTVLASPGAAWVVAGDAGGYHDGFSGRVLAWDGSGFAPSGDAEPAPAFRMERRDGLAPLAAMGSRQLLITATLRHPAAVGTVLGLAAERLLGGLTGAAPSGWGLAEPMTEPWEPAALTAVARERMPRPSVLMLAGGGDRAALGTLRAERSRSSVTESISISVGYDGGPPIGVLPELVAAVAGDADLVGLLAQVRPGRPDCTFAPTWEGVPVPVGLAVGREGLTAAGGVERALAAPAEGAHLIGTAARRVAWFPLGDGASPESWESLRRVGEHLGIGSPPSNGRRSPGTLARESTRMGPTRVID